MAATILVDGRAIRMLAHPRVPLHKPARDSPSDAGRAMIETAAQRPSIVAGRAPRPRPGTGGMPPPREPTLRPYASTRHSSQPRELLGGRVSAQDGVCRAVLFAGVVIGVASAYGGTIGARSRGRSGAVFHKYDGSYRTLFISVLTINDYA